MRKISNLLFLKNGDRSEKLKSLCINIRHDYVTFYGYKELNGKPLPENFKHYKVYMMHHHCANGGSMCVRRFFKIDNGYLDVSNKKMNNYTLSEIKYKDISDQNKETIEFLKKG